MEDSDILREKLGKVSRGAHWFRVLGNLFAAFGFIYIFVYFLRLFDLFGPPEPAAAAASSLVDAVTSFIAAWLLRRGSDAFAAIAALIRELGEIV